MRKENWSLAGLRFEKSCLLAWLTVLGSEERQAGETVRSAGYFDKIIYA
jgi:hypothetical protein